MKQPQGSEAFTAPMLVIFAGLPGTGKSTLAKALAGRMSATYLRIDTLEQAFRDLCRLQVYAEGYELGYRLAADNLSFGGCVVADSCNPLELTRLAWEQVARDAGAAFVNVEVVCSDSEEHRCRVESRKVEVPGLRLPNWAEVTARDHEPWGRPRLTLDTAGRTPKQSLQELMSRLREELQAQLQTSGHDQR